MANETITATLGLDTARFTAGLDRANQGAAKFKQRVEGILGPGLLRGAGIGIIGTTLANGLLSASRRAQEMADELERGGKAVDDNLRAAGELARTWDSIKTAAADAAVASLGFLAQAGEYWGRKIAVALYGEAQVAAAEQSEIDADAAELRLQQARELKQLRRAADEEAEKNLRQTMTLEQEKRLLQDRQLDLLVQMSRMTGDDFDTKRKIIELDRERLRLVGEEQKVTERIAANRLKQAENTAKIAEIEGRIAGVVANAREEIAQVGRERGGNLTLQDYATSDSSFFRRQAARETAELERARQAEMRGNDKLAARIREESARRQERNLPGVAAANNAERQRIAAEASAQVKELQAAVTELKAINTKLEQG